MKTSTYNWHLRCLKNKRTKTLLRTLKVCSEEFLKNDIYSIQQIDVILIILSKRGVI